MNMRVAFWVEGLGAEPADISAFSDADADFRAFEGSVARGATSLAKVLASHSLPPRTKSHFRWTSACDLRTGAAQDAPGGEHDEDVHQSSRM